jgi:hypothetical protein
VEIEEVLTTVSLIPKVFYAILNPAKYTPGGRALEIKIFLPLFLLLVVSCSGEQPTARPTVDATQRWLNAKCPPSEICAPESGPESIGRAYLTAVLAGECEQAASYWIPDLGAEAVENCQQGIVLSDESKSGCRLFEYDIEKVLIEDATGGKSIKFSGYFLHACEEDSGDHPIENLELFFTERDGEWRITGIDG